MGHLVENIKIGVKKVTLSESPYINMLQEVKRNV